MAGLGDVTCRFLDHMLIDVQLKVSLKGLFWLWHCPIQRKNTGMLFQCHQMETPDFDAIGFLVPGGLCFPL